MSTANASAIKHRTGAEAIAAKGWLRAHQWLLARRISQLMILSLFLLGPLAGVWFVKGNLNFSTTLGVLPLTDFFIALQTLATGHLPHQTALIGLAIVVLVYSLIGGRTYCSWVCPINPISDAAAWLRARLRIKGGAHFSRNTRYWLLAMSLVLASLTGSLAWELVNPISMLHRGLIFGVGSAWMIVLAIFLFDLLVTNRGWCGHLCPAGAAYGLLGAKSLLRVRAVKREACNDCMDCFEVCPEPQVIRPALKGADKGSGPVILSAQCTNCARCIDVCSKDVFVFGSRFQSSSLVAPLSPST